MLRGSNPRPTPCKGAALPTELSIHWRAHTESNREPSVLETAALPVAPCTHELLIWSRRHESNVRPLASETNALVP